MSSNTNNALMKALTTAPKTGYVNDNLYVSAGGTSQATAAVVLRSGVNRLTTVVSSGGAVVLPANSDEGADMVYVINDGGQTAVVYPAAGDLMSGSTAASQSLAAGVAGAFLRVPPNVSMPQQSVQTVTSVSDWRPATFP